MIKLDKADMLMVLAIVILLVTIVYTTTKKRGCEKVCEASGLYYLDAEVGGDTCHCRGKRILITPK